MLRQSSRETFRQISQPLNLARAFDRYRRYRGLWTAGQPMSRVAADPVFHVLELAESLREGSYRPATPTQIRIEKADRSERVISIYALRDRVAQRAALQVLVPLTEPGMSPGSFGFRQGRSVAQAIAAGQCLIRSGYGWIVDADIERCFDSIPRRELLESLDAAAGSASGEVIRTLLGWPADEHGLGIPQGAVISPWLCNVYLTRLDSALHEAAIPQVRYADDFIAFTVSQSGARSALALCSRVLEELRLRLHPVKTSIRNACDPFRFLGGALGRVPLLPAPHGGLPCC